MSDCLNCPTRSECMVATNFDKTKKEYAHQKEFEYDPQEHSLPLGMMLGLTNECNLACPYCFVTQSPSRMTLEIAEKSIEWLRGNYVKSGIDLSKEKMSVNFFGGEPLLQFEEVIIPLVEKYHSEVAFGITTNGVGLTPDVIDFLYKYSIHPLLSFDGVPEVQDEQRPGKGFSSFKVILNHIQYLLLRFPYTVMRATLTKHSIYHLYDSVLMAEELGFQKVSFCPNAFEEWDSETEKEYFSQLDKVALYLYKKLSDIHSYPIIQVDPLVKKFEHLDLASNGNLYFNNNIGRCGLGTTTCAITPDGRVIPCQEKTSNPTIVLGTVEKGIDTTAHQNYLEEYWDKINNFTCEWKCSERERLLCLADICPSRMEDQNYKISSPLCVFNRISAKIAAKLHFLCANSVNPYIRQYFNGGTIC